MWILRRYIFQHVFAALLVITIAVLGIQTIFSLVNELGNVGTGHYDTIKAFIYVLMQLPNFLWVVLPIVVLLGSLVSLYTLAASKEVLIIRSAGVSVKSFCNTTLYCAAVIMVFAFLLGGYIVPNMNYQSSVLKNTATGNQVVNMGETSTWFKQDNRYVLIDNIKSSNTINKVNQYEVHKDKISDISHASYASYNPTYQTWDLH